MRLMKVGGGVVGRLAVVAAVAAAVGCGGSGGNNDQGIVFRATGVFRAVEQIDERITCTVPISVDNALVDNSFTLSLTQTTSFPDRTNPFANPCGGFLGLKSDLFRMSLNVQTVLIRYEVPGASIPIPDNPITFGQTIPPTSSPVEPSSGEPGLIYAQLVDQIVPTPIVVFLNQNVDRLPVTPYFMNVFISARGQADDGEEYTTNEVGYQLTIVP